MSEKSEVAAMRARIDAEHEASCRALHAPAFVASHKMINARMERTALLVQAAIDRRGSFEAAKEEISFIMEREA